MNKFGISVDEYSNGRFCLEVIDKDGLMSMYVNTVTPDTLCPDVSIMDGVIELKFDHVLVSNRNDSRELASNMEALWDFLDQEEIRKVINLKNE